MNAIVNTGPGQLQWQDVPTPQPGRGQVRIRTAFCGICATDLEMIKGWKRTGFPSIPGHEWSGVADAVGPGVDGGLAGRPCVAENVLADGGEVGFEHPGGYGQFLLTEARNVRPLSDGIPLDQAALIEPLAVCIRAMNRLKIEHRDSAIVFGDGMIGLLMLALLKLDSVKTVTLVGGRPGRLALAGKLGADSTVNYHDAGKALADSIARSPGSPFANVIEASGSPSAMTLSMDISAKMAKVVVIGDYGSNRADFPWNHLLHRELELIGSNASAGAWDRAVALAAGRKIPLDMLISRRFAASQFAQAVDLVRTSRDAVKILLDWRTEQ
ncbi:MAG: zinc-binding dehydrogenase [Planctomycetes bacterium]|nr:zinc-binding dehydrogenase [Planctomycetota bacterium]